MNKTITLTIDGQPRELKADYLTPAALEYWRAWLAHEARMAHNPFAEFAAKVQALPEDLRAVATREFVAGVNFDVVPKIVLLETIRSLSAVKTLCILVTGEDAITPENSPQPFRCCFPSSSAWKLPAILLKRRIGSARISASRLSANRLPASPRAASLRKEASCGKELFEVAIRGWGSAGIPEIP